MNEDQSNTTYRSDRLLYPKLNGEFFDDKYLDYQQILDQCL